MLMALLGDFMPWNDDRLFGKGHLYLETNDWGGKEKGIPTQAAPGNRGGGSSNTAPGETG